MDILGPHKNLYYQRGLKNKKTLYFIFSTTWQQQFDQKSASLILNV